MFCLPYPALQWKIECQMMAGQGGKFPILCDHLGVKMKVKESAKFADVPVNPSLPVCSLSVRPNSEMQKEQNSLISHPL